jgi:argininosuccinate lyase
MELVRGKAARPLGHLVTLLTVIKGLPTTYNKDLQEDKEPLFDAVDTMKGVVPITTGVISTLTLHPESMVRALDGAMLATDLADYLVRRGVPFRQTHHIAGEAVRVAEDKGVPLTDLTLADLKPLHEVFEDDVTAVWSFESSVEARSAAGGTSRSAVLQQISEFHRYLSTPGSR